MHTSSSPTQPIQKRQLSHISMYLKKLYYVLSLLILSLPSCMVQLRAQNMQESEEGKDKLTLHGSLQTDILTLVSEDRKIGTSKYDDKFMTNTYADLWLQSRHFQAGARLEYLEHPLLGYEPEFKGWGIPYFYVKGSTRWGDLTLGDYYEQFGSGLVLRAYEDRSLGIDNSLRGVRATLKPFKGLSLKLLAGQQRYYWHHRNLDSSSPWTWGGDLELSIDQWVKRMDESNTRLTLGLSAVSNHYAKTETGKFLAELPDLSFPDADHTPTIYQLRLPHNVAAFDARANLQKGPYSFLAEYAWKSQDPSALNSYIYNRGQTLLLSGSYSKRGMSLLLQAKRSEDMAFRSRRDPQSATACYINYLPPFTMQHTYDLANHYPYATQMVPGEWAFQGEVSYTFKRHTPLGGRYGTQVKLNYSHVRGIDQCVNTKERTSEGSNGPRSHFFKMGEDVYFQDINVQVEKKVSPKLKLNFLYSAQRYNQQVVEGHGEKLVKAHIFVTEGKYQFNRRLTLRGEAQYLHSRQDQKDWWFGLLELSVLPSLMFTISDEFNAHVPMHDSYGIEMEDAPENSVHYFTISTTYTHHAHRLQLSYGKTDAGYNCSGGVCRYVPASKGLMISYSFNF